MLSLRFHTLARFDLSQFTVSSGKMARSARFTRPFLPYKTHPQFHPLRHPLLAMSAKQSTPSNLVAFPSVSASLCQLPHATSMQNIAIHPSMYANRAAESEAKVCPLYLYLTHAHLSAASKGPLVQGQLWKSQPHPPYRPCMSPAYTAPQVRN